MTESVDQRESRLDGNAAGGVLMEVFALDPTTAVATCAHCGDQAVLGELLVYADAPAMVMRCPGCMEVVLRCASDRTGVRIEMRGVQLLTATPADAGAS